MKLTRALARKMQFGFTALVTVMLIVGALSYRSLVVSADSERRVQHIHEVLDHIANVRAALESIEAAQQEYGLAGDAAYRRSPFVSFASVEQEERILRGLTADRANQQHRLDTLIGLTHEINDMAKAAAHMHSTDGPHAAAEYFRNARLVQVLAQYPPLLRTMSDEELNLLTERATEGKRGMAQSKALLIAGAIVGLLIATVAAWIAERSKAVRALAMKAMHESKEAQSKYRGLLEAAPDAMIISDALGRIVLVNAQTERLFGYGRDEIIGQPVELLIPKRYLDSHPIQRQSYIARPHTKFVGEDLTLHGLRKGGSEFPVEIMLSPVDSSSGMLVTAAIRDITERRRSAERLAKTVRELKRSNEELQQFAYVASHDLQEPLRMVASYTQLLSERYKGRLDSDADEFIGFAVDGANRMRALIEDLLAYSRAGANGRVLLEISSEVSLNDAKSILHAAIEESGAVVTHDALPRLTTDSVQLSQILQNLIGNAIKYRGDDAPQVHISAHKSNSTEWIFSVRDNGIGIEPEHFDRIFVLFQRLHGREEFTGTGIGLAICTKVVEQLGGRLWVESQLGRGSTFYFTLPQGGSNGRSD
jgi:PAS domain S-box-containing protein